MAELMIVEAQRVFKDEDEISIHQVTDAFLMYCISLYVAFIRFLLKTVMVVFDIAELEMKI